MTLENTWQDFLRLVSDEVGSRVVETWFKSVRLKSIDAIKREVYLEAPNTFVRDWIKKNYILLCNLHFGRLINVSDMQTFITDSRSYAEVSEAKTLSEKNMGDTVVPAVLSHDIEGPLSVGHAASMVREPVKARVPVNEQYSFDSFIVGPHNSFAYAAARAVVENPGNLYNPLFIYGASGLGKTHLLNAIGNGIKAHERRSVVIYQPAARFVTEFINAIRFNKAVSFEERYQKADILLIDDIQLISHKEQTQEVFAHIFNNLYDLRKQLVFTSDMLPENMAGIADRLRSRFTCGLVTDLHAPSIESKIGILQQKAKLNNFVLHDQVARIIASLIPGNIRELEGALVRLIAHASISNCTLDEELVRTVLLQSHDLYRVKKVVDPDMVLKLVAKYYSCTKTALCSTARNKELVIPRHVAMYLMKRLTHNSFRDVGMIFGCDHSTVMHAIEKITSQIQADAVLNKRLVGIEQELLATVR